MGLGKVDGWSYCLAILEKMEGASSKFDRKGLMSRPPLRVNLPNTVRASGLQCLMRSM